MNDHYALTAIIVIFVVILLCGYGPWWVRERKHLILCYKEAKPGEYTKWQLIMFDHNLAGLCTLGSCIGAVLAAFFL